MTDDREKLHWTGNMNKVSLKGVAFEIGWLYLSFRKHNSDWPKEKEKWSVYVTKNSRGVLWLDLVGSHDLTKN